MKLISTLGWFAAILVASTAATGCSPDRVGASSSGGGDGGAGASKHEATGGGAGSIDATEPKIGPIQNAQDTPIGPGSIALASSLVELVPPGSIESIASRLVMTTADTVALVTPEVRERRFRIDTWPPQQTGLRTLFNASDFGAFAVADNGDSTYAVAAQKGGRDILFADRVSPASAPVVRDWSSAPTRANALGIARAGGVTFTAIGQFAKFSIATELDGQVALAQGVAGCGPSTTESDVAVLAVGDRFLAALPVRSGACSVQEHPAKELAIVTSAATANGTTEVVAKLPLQEEYSGGARLFPRPGGAWLVVFEDTLAELFALSDDGQVAFGPTAIDGAGVADLGSQGAVADAVPTADGGLFFAWMAASPPDLEVAHFDASGALVERAEIPIAETIEVNDIHLAPRGEMNILFLDLRHVTIHPTMSSVSGSALDAIEIADPMAARR